MTGVGGSRAGDVGGKKSWRPAALDVDEAELRATVAAVLGEAPGAPAEVVSLSRTPSPFATLFPADVLDVRLANGSELRLFLKHVGEEESTHPDKADPGKEDLVYRDLLALGDLPVVRYHGSRRNRASGRRELFLEYVDGWHLEHHGLEVWYRAAGELARLHAWFDDHRGLLEASGLPHLGADYAWTWARLAGREAARRGPPLEDRLRRLLDRYDGVARLLEEADRTLVHNDLSPKNVVADPGDEPTRICFVDWESAGLGSGLLDVTNLAYGLDDAERERMRRAYLDELDARGGARPEGAALARLEAACESHKALWRLAHCGEWDLPDRDVERFLAEAEDAAARATPSAAPTDRS